MDKKQFFECRKLLAGVSLPGSIKEFLCFAISEKGDELISLVEAKPGEVVLSINDTYIVLHSKHELGADIIEMANNWVEEQYIFMAVHDFKRLVNDLILGKSIGSIPRLEAGSSFRSDFQEMKSSW